MEKSGGHHLNTVIKLITNEKKFDVSVDISGMLHKEWKDITMLYPERKKKKRKLSKSNHEETIKQT